MNEKSYHEIFDSAAADVLSRDVNLWPGIKARLERKSVMSTLRTKPIFLILTILFVLALATGAVYAIGKITGYFPGVGYVETSALRMLVQPVSVTRDGITVSIEQAVVDSERTIIVYKAEGLTIAAANSRGEVGAPFGSEHLLRLPDRTLLKEKINAGYREIPEPLIHQIQTEGGWPNYAWRLVYPSVPSDVNELTLVIPVLQNMPAGAAPENWEITFRLKPAPPEMTFAPIITLPTGSASVVEEIETMTPALSNATTKEGFTFQLDNVIELEDGFIFTGNLSWDASAFPTGEGLISGAVVPTLTDANCEQVPIEEVRLNVQYGEYDAPWSYRTNRKSFVGPLTFTIPSIQTSVWLPPVDVEIDFGDNPQIGQTWEINRDFVVEGQYVRLLSVSLGVVPSTCQGAGISFQLQSEMLGGQAFVGEAVAYEPMLCSGGHGGGGGETVAYEPYTFFTGVSYRELPTGVHIYSIHVAVPYEVHGPWQAQWNPPLSSEGVLTP